MSTVFFEPLVTVWWIITPCTGPQGPLWLRLWSRQSPTSTTVRPSALRARRNALADMGGAMTALLRTAGRPPVAAVLYRCFTYTEGPEPSVRSLCEPIRTRCGHRGPAKRNPHGCPGGE